MSCHRAAAQFGVGVSTTINWVRRWRETGSVAPGQMGGHKPKSIAGEHRAWLLERTKERAFTLRGLVAELAERGLKVDYRTVWSFVHAEKLSFKKTVVAGERDRPDVARRRAQWTKYQNKVAPERLVFIDETWTKTNMAPLRGWALKHLLRKAAARTVDALCAAIGQFLAAFTSNECANYFQNAGYAPT